MQISQMVSRANVNIGTCEQSHMHLCVHVKQVRGIELRRPIKQAQCTQTHSGTHIHACFTNQRACVSGVSGGVVQKARQAKVGDLADQVAVDQDISGGEVSVNIVHV